MFCYACSVQSPHLAQYSSSICGRVEFVETNDVWPWASNPASALRRPSTRSVGRGAELASLRVGSHAGYERTRTHRPDCPRDWCHQTSRDRGGDCARTWTSWRKTLCDILSPVRPPAGL